MMRNVVFNIRDDVNLDKIKNKDILMYDSDHRCFYLTTQQTFFNKYDVMLEKLLRKYDKQFEDNEIKNSEFKADITRFKEEMVKDMDLFKNSVVEDLNAFKLNINSQVVMMRNEYNDFLAKYKETNEKLINMVEQVLNKEE